MDSNTLVRLKKNSLLQKYFEESHNYFSSLFQICPPAYCPFDWAVLTGQGGERWEALRRGLATALVTVWELFNGEPGEAG